MDTARWYVVVSVLFSMAITLATLRHIYPLPTSLNMIEQGTVKLGDTAKSVTAKDKKTVTINYEEPDFIYAAPSKADLEFEKRYFETAARMKK